MGQKIAWTKADISRLIKVDELTFLERKNQDRE
jgi:hypothetical protein